MRLFRSTLPPLAEQPRRGASTLGFGTIADAAVELPPSLDDGFP
jgi:hypothetical protein